MDDIFNQQEIDNRINNEVYNIQHLVEEDDFVDGMILDNFINNIKDLVNIIIVFIYIIDMIRTIVRNNKVICYFLFIMFALYFID